MSSEHNCQDSFDDEFRGFSKEAKELIRKRRKFGAKVRLFVIVFLIVWIVSIVSTITILIIEAIQ